MHPTRLWPALMLGLTLAIPGLAGAAQSPADAALAAGIAAYDADDREQAAAEFRRAAELGSADGAFRLAVMYETGDGIGASMDRALEWYRIAADRGSERAQFNLGHLFATGRTVEQDLAESARYYAMAAQQDNPHAQVALSLILFRGEGNVTRDLVNAYRWITLAVHNYEPTHFRDTANEIRRMIMDSMTEAQRAEGRRLVDAHYAGE